MPDAMDDPGVQDDNCRPFGPRPRRGLRNDSDKRVPFAELHRLFDDPQRHCSH
jgi:hypothetical protein